MSKIYNKYLELKEQDSGKLYLFRCGGFYIFLADDAKKINDYVVLKITSFAKNVDKCGFPIASLDSYLKVFKNHKLDVVVVENYDLYTTQEKYEKIIVNVNIKMHKKGKISVYKKGNKICPISVYSLQTPLWFKTSLVR